MAVSRDDRARTAPPRDEPDSEVRICLEEAMAHLAELRAHAAELWAVKVAEIKLGLWKKAFGIAAAILGLVFGVAFVAVSVFFLIAGAADGFATLVSSRWLGYVLAGVAGMAIVGIAFFAARRALTARAVEGANGKKE